MADITEIQSALAAATAGTIVNVGGIPHAVIPDSYDLKDLEIALDNPTRHRSQIVVDDVKSFVSLANEFKGDATKVYGTVTPPKFVAIFNAPSAKAGPGWNDHRVSYVCPLSIEWKTWTGKNKQPMNQADFAQFIEDNLPDLLDGATLLEVSRTLEAKKKVNFASGIRLSDGQNEFTYEEQIEGTAGKGKFKVPEVFELGIPVFTGGPLYKVRARLRYRINEGKLVLWYDIERSHKILEDAVKAVWSEIEVGTELPILHAAV
ncbi:DUF2303 family protein [Burkholderia sp. Bp8990]|uniref:DUF2303 family protein n=1 Tax=Burkholderia sp. Bp8990 TaxID=2184552 RepID=UPI000F5AB922|nr:DUF2303 family protein [Burkholderia sp. Bp8990]RQS39794.1 DUF2303 family protein [Burkholderia sp. Bp8990]